MADLPPMLKQYRQIKARHPDALVLFRLGDFYELFQADAELVARQLNLTLTTRRFSKTVSLPMCGIPHQRLNSYIARLIERGHRVAVVEQLQDARHTKGLVDRGVVRVITPGTVVEDTLLAEQELCLLAGIVVGDGRQGRPRGYGLAVVDLSTGEFSTTQITPDSPDQAESCFWEELARLRPNEIVLPRSLAEQAEWSARLTAIHPTRLSPLDEADFDPAQAAGRLKAHLGVSSLESFGCADLPLALSAAGAVLSYLQNNQISDLAHIVRLTTYHPSAYMSLDPVTRRNLELTATLRDGRYPGSLCARLDRTLTAMGGRRLRSWLTRPLLDVSAINERLAAVSDLVEHGLRRGDMRQALNGLADMERLVGRIGFGNANARDLVSLRKVLEQTPRIKETLQDTSSALLQRLNNTLDMAVLGEMTDLIARAVVDAPPILLQEGGLIRPGYDAELDKLRQVACSGRDWLAAFEVAERERTGIKNLRVRYNQVFGFFIEVTKSYLSQVPLDYERRATVTHAERFVSPALRAREAEILTAEERINELEYELFVEVRRRVAAQSASLTLAARALAELDVLTALAETAAVYGYSCPTLDDSTDLIIRQGRHVVVEHSLADGERFVPNDTVLTPDQRLMVITGPNMSGKSVYIRQVALIALLAQMGSLVPAQEARVGLVDRIFVRAGASDDIAQGRSTFLVEMSETGYILRHATRRSLIVLDEVGRGTSTYDGMSIAWAIAQDIHNRIEARTLFATHFQELTRLAQELAAARCYSMAVAEQDGRAIFMRHLIAGCDSPTSAPLRQVSLQVARLAGLPEHVIAQARDILARLEGRERAVEQPDIDVIHEEKAAWPDPPARQSGWRSLDETILDAVLTRLGRLDIGNLTPVQALVILNELQQMLQQQINLDKG